MRCQHSLDEEARKTTKVSQHIRCVAEYHDIPSLKPPWSLSSSNRTFCFTTSNAVDALAEGGPGGLWLWYTSDTPSTTLAQ